MCTFAFTENLYFSPNSQRHFWSAEVSLEIWGRKLSLWPLCVSPKGKVFMLPDKLALHWLYKWLTLVDTRVLRRAEAALSTSPRRRSTCISRHVGGFQSFNTDDCVKLPCCSFACANRGLLEDVCLTFGFCGNFASRTQLWDAAVEEEGVANAWDTLLARLLLDLWSEISQTFAVLERHAAGSINAASQSRRMTALSVGLWVWEPLRGRARMTDISLSKPGYS